MSYHILYICAVLRIFQIWTYFTNAVGVHTHRADIEHLGRVEQ
jgi:hypothetical protein